MITSVLDLRQKMLAVRDQSRRKSCLAFAASGAHEHHLPATQHLSVEYLFYHAVQRMPRADPAGGVTMPSIREALSQEGQPRESSCPYLSKQPAPGAWVLPTVSDQIYKANVDIGKHGLNDVIVALAKQKTVVLGLIITDSFYRPNSAASIEDIQPDIERGGHAVLAAGHGASTTGERYLLIRNSWGIGWGDAGYAWLSESYVNRHLRETATLV